MASSTLEAPRIVDTKIFTCGCANNSSVDIPLGNSQKALICGAGGGINSCKGLYIFNASSSGGVTKVDVFPINNMTITMSTNNINFANASGSYITFLVIIFAG